MVVVDIVAAIDFNRLFRDWKRKEEKGQEQAEQNGSKVGRMLIVLSPTLRHQQEALLSSISDFLPNLTPMFYPKHNPFKKTVSWTSDVSMIELMMVETPRRVKLETKRKKKQ